MKNSDWDKQESWRKLQIAQIGKTKVFVAQGDALRTLAPKEFDPERKYDALLYGVNTNAAWGGAIDEEIRIIGGRSETLQYTRKDKIPTEIIKQWNEFKISKKEDGLMDILRSMALNNIYPDNWEIKDLKYDFDKNLIINCANEEVADFNKGLITSTSIWKDDIYHAQLLESLIIHEESHNGLKPDQLNTVVTRMKKAHDGSFRDIIFIYDDFNSNYTVDNIFSAGLEAAIKENCKTVILPAIRSGMIYAMLVAGDRSLPENEKRWINPKHNHPFQTALNGIIDFLIEKADNNKEIPLREITFVIYANEDNFKPERLEETMPMVIKNLKDFKEEILKGYKYLMSPADEMLVY